MGQSDEFEDIDGIDAEEEEALAREIIDGEEDVEDEIVLGEDIDVPDTPSKSGKLRGRPKGRRRARSPTPPQDLPPHELYFFQNRPGANKTSTNTLPSSALLNHEDYFANINAYKDPHEEDKVYLKDLHKRSFDQWVFELEEGFNICLYGYGSKRELVLEYAEYLYQHASRQPKILVVNGYTPALTLKDILTTISTNLLPKSQATKLPAQPAALLESLLATFTASPPATPIYLFINSIDAAPIRKGSIQTALARLASHPSISIVATADTPNFSLMWDISLRTQFHFLFHDTTTFAPYTAEIDVVDDVNTLLGRSGRRIGGKDGVTYVLRSLPENARNLFRILVAEQLALAAESDGAVLPIAEEELVDDDEPLLGFDDLEEPETPSKRGRGRPAKARPKPKPKPLPSVVEGVEYRTLYHKAVEEFVCSSEMGFRTLLKEFHDHQIIESRKDGMGTERLSVPFEREELESLLEELV